MKFRIYRDKHNEFRWTLYAKNGRIIADSSEGYKRKEFRWTLYAKNGRIIADSSGGYKRKGQVTKAIVE